MSFDRLSQVQRIPIDDARAFVETVVGDRLVGLVPDEIDRVCDGLSWARCDQAEEKSDVQIARDTGLFDIRFEGEIWVAPEASFSPVRKSVGLGCFALPAEALGELVGTFQSRYGESFYALEVIAFEGPPVRDSGQKVYVYQHDGFYTVGALVPWKRPDERP